MHRAGTIGLARQELAARDGESVGTLTSEVLAPSLAALTALEQATGALAAGDDPEAEDRYAAALDAAVRLGGYDTWQDALAEHRIDVPEPPPLLRWPDLGIRPGAPQVRARGVAVDERLIAPVDLALDGGDRLLVTGANGAGKSTLLAVLAGALQPTQGDLWTAKEARVVLITQETAAHHRGLTAREAYVRHVGRLVACRALRDADAVRPGALGLLDSEAMATPVGRMSQGQQRRLDLALALAGRPSVILLDEPTNHLSSVLVNELTEAIRHTSAAVVVATHDRQLLRDLADWPRLEIEGPRGATMPGI
ncbi:ATP-binding cassette domain-containing protein [Dactylosporangium sp. NPDC049742]|uniref:ATP-binding cassette domain-containing protein n=1 Tax=Dactylosporangium sp. NPDC049742 TaxID=3154737 RepID=UPI00341E85F4